MNLKHLSLMALFAIASYTLQSQTETLSYSFTYDRNGNRIQRNLIIIENPENLASKNNIDDSKEQQDEETMERENTIIEKFNELDAKIYPNPTKGQLIIELLNFDEVNDGMILISDMQGKVIFSQKKIDKKTAIDLSNQPAGKYLLRINANKLQKEWTILKQ